MAAGSKLLASGLTAFPIPNGALVATVSAGALTVAVKTAAGNDPSPNDPLYCAIPSASSGGVDSFIITSALTLTVPNGATLGIGAVVSIPFALWLGAVNDSGVVKLVVGFRSIISTNLYGSFLSLWDGQLIAALALGGGGDNSGSAWHAATTILTPSPVRVVGRLEFNSGLVTPGVWDVVPVAKQTSSGVVPGRILQEFSIQDSIVNTTTVLIPWDNTIPQKTEGAAWAASNLTPQSAANWFEFDILLNAAHSVAGEVIVSVFRDAGASAIGCAAAYVPAADEPVQVKLKFRNLAASLSIALFNIRYGPAVAGTMTVNGAAGAGKLNGTLYSNIIIRELAG
jgi:hypothetical protein